MAKKLCQWQIKNKQEQAAYIKQLERSLEENKIENNAVL